LAKLVGAFHHQNAYFHRLRELMKRLHRDMFSIAMMPLNKLPKITMQQYLDNDEAYQKIALEYGNIDPHQLFNALQSSVTPALNPQELNLMNARLKQRVNELEKHQATVEQEKKKEK